MVGLVDKYQKILLGLLSAGIRNKPFSAGVGADIDWPAIMKWASEHFVTTLVYGPLASNKQSLAVPDDLLDKLRIDTLNKGFKQERDYLALGSVLGRFAAAGIPVIPLKGLYLRELYPDPCLRIMGDYDILVKPCDMDRAGAILLEAGYAESLLGDKHVTYTHETFPMIELHRTLTGSDNSGNFEDFEEQAWKNAKRQIVSGVEVLSLAPADMEVYQVLHMASHIVGSGLGLRQLCDFVLFTEANEGVIDWKDFDYRTASLHIEVFAKALFQLCSLLFDLKLPEEIPECGEPDMNLMKSIVEDIFSGGFQKGNNDRITANRMLYYSGGGEAKSFTGRLKLYLKLFFPDADRLDTRYGYARKYRLLLPFAWIHRFVYCLVRRDIDIYEKTAAFKSGEAVAICENRSRILRKLGLLD